MNSVYNDKTLLVEEEKTFGGMFNPWRVKRVEKLISIFGLDWFKGKKILEMGCGHGNIGLYLESLGSTVHFSDAREEALAKVKKKKPDAVVFVIDQETEWRLEDHYDLIIHFGILYNLNYWEKDLNKVLSHCSYAALESAVHKFDNENEYKIVNHSYPEPYGPARQIGTLTSSINIEKVVRENNFYPVRYDDQDLDLFDLDHVSYSWVEENNESAPKYGVIKSWWDNPFCRGRRFWVLTKQQKTK